LLLLGLAPVATTPCAADTCWNWLAQFPHEVNAQLVPQGSYPSKLAVHGSYVYAVLAAEIVVLDLSDSEHPTEVDRWTLGGNVRDILATDDCLVVLRAEAPATAAAFLEFYSLADPAHPVFGSDVPFAATNYEFAAAGGILYAKNGGEVQLFDIGDPSAPEYLASILQNCNDLSADAGRLYFAVGNLLYQYDTTTPGTPSLRGWWTAPSNILDIESQGELAYMVYGQTMTILDFQQPLVPQTVGELAQQPYDPQTLYDIMRVGDIVYLRRSLDYDTKDLLAVDVSDPAALLPLWYAPLDLVASIAAGPHFVAIGERDFDSTNPRLAVLSFDPSTLRPSFVEPGPGAPLAGGFDKIAVVDDVAWWGASWRLTGVDVSSMPSTSEVGSLTFTITGDLQALAGQNGLLYLGVDNYARGLQVYDVSDPGNATMVGYVEEYLNPLAMLIGDGVLYVADGTDGLVIFSLQDPQHPTFVQRVPLPGTICDLALAGNLLCIGAAVEGMLVADCSDPENPVVVGRTLPGMYCYGLTTDGSYAYSRYFELSVVDLAVPTAPTVVATMPANVGSSISAEGGRILYHDGFLYLAAHTDGLQMIDVRDPLQPHSITDASVATFAKTVSIHRDHVLLVGSLFVAGSTTTAYEGLIGLPVQCSTVVGVSDPPIVQRSPRLSVFPNPFNPTTTVTFSGRSGMQSKVRVYDVRGRIVEALFDGIQAEPEQSIVWKAERLVSGVYFLHYESEGMVATKKVTLLK
jgi:hypothetical protein